jgi:hypothetical protein
MASAAKSTSQEYWRPANPDVARVIPSLRGICWHCGMDYTPGARYCHSCGVSRETPNVEHFPRGKEPEKENDLSGVFRRFGFSPSTVVFLVTALACALAAVMTGVVYREETLVDWQAVQTWRIEWLLGAVVALLAGILLRHKRS